MPPRLNLFTNRQRAKLLVARHTTMTRISALTVQRSTIVLALVPHRVLDVGAHRGGVDAAHRARRRRPCGRARYRMASVAHVKGSGPLGRTRHSSKGARGDVDSTGSCCPSLSIGWIGCGAAEASGILDQGGKWRLILENDCGQPAERAPFESIYKDYMKRRGPTGATGNPNEIDRLLTRRGVHRHPAALSAWTCTPPHNKGSTSHYVLA